MVSQYSYSYIIAVEVSIVRMFCSSRQRSRSSRQPIRGPLACLKAPSGVQCGVSGKKLTEGSKIAGFRYILTGLKVLK